MFYHTRGIAERRHNTWSKINKKYSILEAITTEEFVETLKDEKNRLSKLKVHCSCQLCTQKTKDLGLPAQEQAKWVAAEKEIAQYT